jgi:hypothetical protein
MTHFKEDRHALRWPKMRETKLVAFLRYTFQPGIAVFSFIGSTISIISAFFGNANIVGLYFGAMTVNYLKWTVYCKFKQKS